jgi:hypothetical protein
MNVQLQKAVTAMRAGKKEEARLLLEELAASDPHNVHVLFLLSGLVRTRDEQMALVARVLEIDAGHVGAQKRWEQLQPRTAAAKAAAAVASEPAEGATQAAPTEMQLPSATRMGMEEPSGQRQAPPEPAPPLAAPDKEPALPVSDKLDDFMAQAEADTVPPWLARPEAAAASLLAGTAKIPQLDLVDKSDDLPDWLQEEPAQQWLERLGATQKPAPWTTGAAPRAAAVESKRVEPRVTSSPSPSSAPAAASSKKRLLAGLSLAAGIVAILFVYVFITTFFLN